MTTRPSRSRLSVRSRLVRGCVAAAVVGASLPIAFASPGAAGTAAPVAFTLRYSHQGWTDLIQAGAAQLSCGPDEGCADPTVPASYVDVDTDPSTVNSSRATVVVPPGATLDWAGLYWAGDVAQRLDATPARCAGADPAQPATPPPDRTRLNQVRVAVNGGGYSTVTSNALSTVTAPDGGPGFQAYGDITALLRSAASPLTLTVADLQIAQGPGCSGGWTVLIAYSYPDGPDRTYAPDYRTVAVYDGVIATTAGAAQPIALAGLALPAAGTVSARVAGSLLVTGQAQSLSLGSRQVPLAGTGTSGVSGAPGPGYHRATSTVPPDALNAGTSSATAAVTTARDGFVAAVLGLSTGLPVQVNLSLTTTIEPALVSVGDQATLTVTLRNDADLPDTGVTVTTHLPAGLTVLSTPDGYDADTGVWKVGRVGAQSTATLDLLVRVTRPGTLAATAEVSSTDLPDTDPKPGIVTILAAAAPTSAPPPDPAVPAAATQTGLSLPTLAPGVYFGIGVFALGLLALSIVVIRVRSNR